MIALAWFFCGVLFAIGLGVSGMTQPAKVIGFLNPVGGWDPSLAFVMLGAIGIHVPGYLLRKRRKAPLLATEFQLPTRTDLSPRLIIGASMFGLGWGIAGYCPGPALVSVSSGTSSALFFMAAMLGGMVLHRALVPAEQAPPHQKAA